MAMQRYNFHDFILFYMISINCLIIMYLTLYYTSAKEDNGASEEILMNYQVNSDDIQSYCLGRISDNSQFIVPPKWAGRSKFSNERWSLDSDQQIYVSRHLLVNQTLNNEL